MENINKGMLHRAFRSVVLLGRILFESHVEIHFWITFLKKSVFLFDSQGRLLLQQRADEKVHLDKRVMTYKAWEKCTPVIHV